MSDIEHVLVTIPFSERQIGILSSALAPARATVITDKDIRTIGNSIKTIDVAFLKGQIPAQLLNAPALKWIHCNAAGLERSATRELFEKGIVLTSSAGRSAPALAEQALMFMLALNFGYPGLYFAQRKRDWRSAKSIVRRNTPLCECTLGILGTGHTGSAVAARAKALGMRVEGYRRKSTNPPPGFDHVYSREAGDTIDSMLQAVDFLVLAAPLTDQTAGIIGRRELAMMKPGSVVVNIARGSLIDEHALIDALDQKEISGAGLDVFTGEPLSKNSPLWEHPMVLITPHGRPTMTDREDRVLHQLIENIELYRSGSGLKNQLSADDIYTGESAVSRTPADAGKSPVRKRVSRVIPKPARNSLRCLKKWLKSRRKKKGYPLRPTRRIRRDACRYQIDQRVHIEAYWKKVGERFAPSISLFADEYEVVRFDCLGPGAGHYHVADNSGFHRINLPEPEKAAQIERGLFEIQKNLTYYLKKNPLRVIRELEVDPEAVSRACAEAKPTLLAYATKTDSMQTYHPNSDLRAHDVS